MTDYWEPLVGQFASLARKVAGKCQDPALVASIIPHPGPCGSLLSDPDVCSIEIFIREFTSQNLLPFMERNVQTWSSEVQSRKKGITGKLFNVGRKWFGGGGGGSSTTSLVPDTFILDPTTGHQIFVGLSHELLQRRLADHAFMLKDFRFAYTIYDGLRKDLQGNEKALYYIAGCQEMIALCIMMVDASGRASAEQYINSAIEAYKKMDDFVRESRACMMFYEVLKEKGMYREAPILLNKMAGVSISLLCI